MCSLAGRMALVTGAGRGIGRAIALRLAAEGAAVAIHYAHDDAMARSVAAAAAKRQVPTLLVRADLAVVAQVRQLFAHVLRAWGRLDILVNNAAVAAAEPLTSASEATFERLFAVNVRGTFFAMQEAARCMGAGGRIINISSSVTAVGSPGLALYGGTKGAIEQFTLAAARELGPRGITVNTVSPGLTRTAMLDDVVPVAAQEQLVAATPLNRLGEPEDIAGVVAYLAGPDAAWLTGQNIRANGGL